MMDMSVLRDCVRSHIGDITFLEAHQKTGRILNITVTGTDATSMPRLLNFLTSPNVVIWSAVIASCAVPNLFAAQELLVKEYIYDEDLVEYKTSVDKNIYSCKTSDGQVLMYELTPIYLQGVTFADGSIAHDLPMNRLQQLFNVDNFIVSQVNPHIQPFLFHSIGCPIPLFDKLFRFLQSEFQLYCTSLLVGLREFGLMDRLSILNNLIEQKYTGDVTILPDVLLSDYSKLLSNPSVSYVQRCIEHSKRSTWKYLSRLHGLLAVEMCLDKCLTTLRKQAMRKQSSLIMSASQNISFGAGNTPRNRNGERSRDDVGNISRVFSFQVPSNPRLWNIPQTILQAMESNIGNDADDDDSNEDEEYELEESGRINDERLHVGNSNMSRVLSHTELCSDVANIIV